MSKFEQVEIIHNETGAYAKGELVVTHKTAWMVAIDGEVKVLQKNEWTLTKEIREYGSILDGLFDGTSNNDPFGRLFGRN